MSLSEKALYVQGCSVTGNPRTTEGCKTGNSQNGPSHPYVSQSFSSWARAGIKRIVREVGQRPPILMRLLLPGDLLLDLERVVVRGLILFMGR